MQTYLDTDAELIWEQLNQKTTQIFVFAASIDHQPMRQDWPIYSTPSAELAKMENNIWVASDFNIPTLIGPL